MAFFKELGDLFEGAAQGIGDAVGAIGSNLDDGLHSLGRGFDDFVRGDFSGVDDALHDVGSDFDDMGEDLFGKGSWLKGGFNYLTTGNPWSPTGDLAYDAVHGNLNSDSIKNFAVNYATNQALGQVLPSNMTGNAIADGAIKSGISSGVKAGIQGGDVGQAMGRGAVMGGASAGASALQDYYQGSLATAPDVGTMLPEGADASYEGAKMDFDWNAAGPLMAKLLGNNDAQSKGGTDWGNIVSGLGSIYLNNRARKSYGNQISALQGLFSPDGAYSQTLEKELARRDAAGGRRSQYGARNVELLAKLATNASQQAPTLAKLYAGQDAARTGGLRSLYTMADQAGMFKPGSQLGNVMQQGKNLLNYGNASGDTLMSGGSGDEGFFDEWN